MQAEGMKGPLKEENKDKALIEIKTIYCTAQEALHNGIYGAGGGRAAQALPTN